jgi:hypothetical protein
MQAKDAQQDLMLQNLSSVVTSGLSSGTVMGHPLYRRLTHTGQGRAARSDVAELEYNGQRTEQRHGEGMVLHQ